MKTSVKGEGQQQAKRDLFTELSEGMKSLAEGRESKRTLRTHTAEYRTEPTIAQQELVRVPFEG